MAILGGDNGMTNTGGEGNPPADQQTPQGAGEGQGASPYDYAKMVGENGGLNENWREGLPEDIRNEPCLNQIKTIGTLAKSYVNAQHQFGANRVAVPGQKSTPEEWDAFYQAGGRPEDAAKYELPKDNIPEGIDFDAEQVSAFRQVAFENGLSQKAFGALLAYDAQRAAAAKQAAEQAYELEGQETRQRLQQEYGDRFPALVNQCNRTLRTFGLEGVLAEKGLLNNYDVIKALAKVGDSISESRLEDGDESGTLGIQEKIDAIRNNPDDPYYHSEHPAHDSQVENMRRLLLAKANAMRK